MNSNNVSELNDFNFEVYYNGVLLSTWVSDMWDPSIVKEMILSQEPQLPPEIVVVLKPKRRKL